MLHQQVYVGVAVPQFQHKAAWEAAYSNRSKWGWGRWKRTSGWWWEAGAHSILGDTILSYCISPRGPELGERKSIDGCYAHAPLFLLLVCHNSDRGRKTGSILPLPARSPIGKTQGSIPGLINYDFECHTFKAQWTEDYFVCALVDKASCLIWHYSCAKTIYYTHIIGLSPHRGYFQLTGKQ